MTHKKEMIKKGEAVFQMINLVLAMFALVFLISLTNIELISAGETPASMKAAGWELEDKTWTKDKFPPIHEDSLDTLDLKTFTQSLNSPSASAPNPVSITGTGTGVLISNSDSVFDFSGTSKNFETALSDGSLAKSPEAQKFWGVEDVDGNVVKFENGARIDCSIPDACKTFDKGSSTASQFLGLGQGTFMDSIVSGASWGLVAYGVGQMVGSMIFDEDEQVQAFSTSIMAGAFVGRTAMVGLGEGGFLTGGSIGGFMGGGWIPGFDGLTAGQAGFVWGGIVAVALFVILYEEIEQETIIFTCYPWDAPIGGDDCEKCNTQPGDLPCSEYQCRSLGQACELINQGTAEERCEYVSRTDVEPPTIETWDDALLLNYEYDPDNTINPPDYGVNIINTLSTTGCAPAFTPLSFGIQLNEPGKCKLDYDREREFEDMDFFFGDSPLFRYNHTQIMSLPGPGTAQNGSPVLQNDGNFELYTRCMDSNGNMNEANFVLKFCVEQGPDTTPPLIVTTNLLNGMPIAFNQSEVDLEVYVNEPVDCKWSKLDQIYDEMENQMVCSSSESEINAQLLFTCETTLNGLKSREDNDFFFRCKDDDENENVESYEFTLIGTQPLIINSVEPNGTVRDSTDAVRVVLEAETSAGYNEGRSTCYYSSSGEEDTFIQFYNTDSHVHDQELYLPEGDYTYKIRCVDLGGNSDNDQVTFSVESDSDAPVIARAYHEETYLKLVTNEKAECVYDTVNCDYLFDDGTTINNVDGLDHFTNWNTKTILYVKCQDEYGNRPAPNSCSMIVRAFANFEIDTV